jgi:hypothetical protein
MPAKPLKLPAYDLKDKKIILKGISLLAITNSQSKPDVAKAQAVQELTAMNGIVTWFIA